ncbi:MAG: hypothetical protein K0U68_11850 [Gammaproteobacteria bacterium]|nr:hypothetical protein [Gammaproteobacteria bacterium]
MRGGSWNNNARRARSAYRNRRNPGERNNNQGFRFAAAQTSVDTWFDQINILSVSGNDNTWLTAKTKCPSTRQ